MQAAQIRADALDDIVAHRRQGVPRPDGRLRPLPRPQVRPDPAGRLLRPARPCSPACSTGRGNSPRRRPDASGRPAFAPLAADRSRLEQERSAVETRGAGRIEPSVSQLEARWTRPPADRYGTEEAFPPVEARYVRLVVAGRDDDPDARAGFHIDEFEAWTAEETRGMSRRSRQAAGPMGPAAWPATSPRRTAPA